jgi:DNA polymerase-4
MDVGVTLGNLDSNSFIQLELPLDRRPPGHSTPLSTRCATDSDRPPSRAVLLGQDQGVSVPLLPD